MLRKLQSVDNFAGGLLRWQTGSDSAGITVEADMGEKRFLTLADVGEVLNISSSQTYALVRSGELPAIQIGGRGQWRVESRILEEFIAQAYRRSAPQSGSMSSEGASADQ